LTKQENWYCFVDHFDGSHVADRDKDAMKEFPNTKGPNIQNLHNQTSYKRKYIERHECLLPAMWNNFTSISSSDCLSYLREEVDESVIPSSLFGIPAKFRSEDRRRLICTTCCPGDADAIDCYGADIQYQKWPVYFKFLYYWLLIFHFRKVKLNVPVSFMRHYL